MKREFFQQKENDTRKEKMQKERATEKVNTFGKYE